MAVAAKAEDITRRLVHVRYAAAALAEAELSLRDAVRLARSAGATQEQVDTAVGLGTPSEET
jgi:nucleotide-binding universal stress UspA family protein